MSKAVIDQSKCDRSINCKAKKECPVDAFVRENDTWVISDECIACEACFDSCCQKCIDIE